MMRVRPWAVIAATLVALLASPPLANAAPPGADPPGQKQLRGRSGTGSVYAATIRRTEYGIPHVLAADFGGLGYGYGHAFAEDNLCTLAEMVVTVSGDRSRHFGPDRLSGDQTAFTPVTNLDSDMYYRSLNDAGTVAQLEQKPAPLGPTVDLRALVAGYVAGYNRYLRDKGVQNLPDPTCRGQAWVRPMTATDMWRILYDANQLAGLSSLKGEIGAAQPGAAKRAGVPRVKALAPALGSNAVAVGRDASRARTGMLLANPHFPWSGINRIYQVQMTIPGVMNVTGGSFYGTPVVEIGHTSGVAWTHTISPAQRFTLFQLRLAPDDPTKYVVDGETVPMTSRTVQVPVRLPSGEISYVSRTLHSTRYGPMMASGWTSTTGFAIRGAGANNLRSFNEWLAMGRSQSVQGLRAAQDEYQGLPFIYTVAADSTGVAHLSDSSVVPHVTDEHAQRCVTAEGRAVYPGQTILDGARSECNWGSDSDAIEPGIFGPRVNPSLTRADHVSNANQSAWLSNPAQPVTGIRASMGTSVPSAPSGHVSAWT
jgi:acyl-homoserine-lactone acylase